VGKLEFAVWEGHRNCVVALALRFQPIRYSVSYSISSGDRGAGLEAGTDFTVEDLRDSR
jgi:hypothetical protein